jgi:hypothetical protein
MNNLIKQLMSPTADFVDGVQVNKPPTALQLRAGKTLQMADNMNTTNVALIAKLQNELAEAVEYNTKSAELFKIAEAAYLKEIEQFKIEQKALYGQIYDLTNHRISYDAASPEQINLFEIK